MSTIESYNNEGTQHLCGGRWKEAAACFMSAIRALRGQNLQAPEHEMIRPLEIITAFTPVSTTFLKQTQLDHNILIIFPTSFKINLSTVSTSTVPRASQNHHEAPEDGMELTAILSAALFYNLSLAHHACAMACQGGLRLGGYSCDEVNCCYYQHHHQQFQESKFYEKAGRFYGIAAAMAQRAPSLLVERHPLLMAIFNNWAHASFQLLDLTTCSQCQEAMQLLLSLPPPAMGAIPATMTHNPNVAPLTASLLSDAAPVSISTFEIEQRRVVVMNLLLLQSRMRSAPAA